MKNYDHNTILFIKSLNEEQEMAFLVKETKSFDSDSLELSEAFRNPNLQIDYLRELQSKQDKSTDDLKSKLNSMDQIQSHIKASNFFVQIL